MKLIKLRSIANNATRDSILGPESLQFDPFKFFKPHEIIIVDLLRGKLTPDREGDDVEKYYTAMSRWFHQALEKESIPIDVIETAQLIITPNNRECIIVANGRTFKSFEKAKWKKSK